MERIVVGVDGSLGSRRALRWAVDEARTHGARLEVIATWNVPALAAAPTYGVAPPIEEYAAASQEVLDGALGEVADGLRGVDVRALVVEGSAAQVLIEAADGADLLVVGSRGLGGFKGLLLGSVSQHCATHAPCPVVVVPTPES